MRRSEGSGALREDLEHRIRTGTCVYCRAPAAPDRPLTREHVIPQAKGGRRNDTRIIVPACVRCNQRRGCQEVVLFLLARPGRISAFLDYLGNLSPEVVRELDLRVFAELYAAVWLLGESATGGAEWRQRLRQLCSGRRLHRRRYAARRIVVAVGGRLERSRDRGTELEGPTCLLPGAIATGGAGAADGMLSRASATLLGTLSVLWGVPAERVMEELSRERERQSARSARAAADTVAYALPEMGMEEEEEGVVSLDGWARRGGRRRRSRIDQRRGRGTDRRGGRFTGGRAA
ncbi:MAG TPA: HNH endonuclease [Longimicrobiaceae bacterium]|nr:HNH endonuclease [Longimicrobiaceae bacterium]